jgi:hypothetical protein
LHPQLEKRDFYFQGYQVMLNKLEERLTELPAASVLAYFRKYPVEAMAHFQKFNSNERDQFISHLGYDFWVEGNSHNTIPTWINEVIIENPDCKAIEPEIMALGRKMVEAYK